MRSWAPRPVGVMVMSTVTHCLFGLQKRGQEAGVCDFSCPWWSIPGPSQCGHRRKCVNVPSVWGIQGDIPQYLRAPGGQEKEVLISRLKVGRLLAQGAGLSCVAVSPWAHTAWHWAGSPGTGPGCTQRSINRGAQLTPSGMSVCS